MNESSRLRVLPVLEEHGWIDPKILPEDFQFPSQSEPKDISQVKAFGLQGNGQVSYYIGYDWLDESRGLALRVKPKIENLDVTAMLETCLGSIPAARILGKCYDLRTSKEFLPAWEEDSSFLYVIARHYLVLLAELLNKPLLKGYILREENLRAKLKGKVLLGEHISRNILGMRPDRLMCRYQEYSEDCPENRLLHSAYAFSLGKLSEWSRLDPSNRSFLQTYSALEPRFRSIGYLRGPSKIFCSRANPLYREYSEALRLAILLCRVQGYEESHGSARRVPPYIIDMAKLFELYVYQALYTFMGPRVLYQSKGKYGNTDFLDLDERLVIDTKYKKAYEERYEIEDIRQVAGYARDIGILDELRVASTERDRVLDCLIIYPKTGAASLTEESYKSRERIEQFHRIMKLGIGLPMKKTA